MISRTECPAGRLGFASSVVCFGCSAEGRKREVETLPISSIKYGECTFGGRMNAIAVRVCGETALPDRRMYEMAWWVRREKWPFSLGGTQRANQRELSRRA